MPDYISIIIPGFNEEKRILETLKTLFAFCKTNFERFEIIFVDDGSSDRTWNIVESEFNNSHFFKAIHLKKNRGKGYAVREGMLSACGQYRFFTDADLPYGTECFLQALNILKRSSCDIVTGARDLSESRSTAGSYRSREIFSRVFSVIVNVLLNIHIKDTQCGFKGFTAHSVTELFGRSKINSFAFDVELFVLAGKLGFVIKKMPVTLIKSKHSKVRLTHDPFRMLVDILRLWFFTKILSKISFSL